MDYTNDKKVVGVFVLCAASIAVGNASVFLGYSISVNCLDND
jgi:hypothetical protein